MRSRLFIVATMLLPMWTFAKAGATSGTLLPQADDENKPPLTSAEIGDSTKIRTIDDVVNHMLKERSIRDENRHWDKVWSRKSYLNFGYNSSTLSPKNDYRTGVGDAHVGDFKSNYGFSLQCGRSYPLHKKSIANILRFYIDYTSVDLNFSHYASGVNADGTDQNLYDSNSRITEAGNSYYIPWNLEKFEGSYGMMLGPSFTVAPFTHTRYWGLHYLKFNMYFHIGYQASILYLKGKETSDVNQPSQELLNTYYSYNNTLTDAEKMAVFSHNKMDDILKLNWGHGLLTTFGLSLTWKGIGLGYEHRVAHNRYKPFSSGDDEFGGGIYKFKTVTNRIFITFRLGK